MNLKKNEDLDLKEVKGKVDPIDSAVGRRVKVRRIMMGVSQQELGNYVNVSVQQIQKYEKATNRISSGRLWAFSKILGVPITYFYENIENEVDTSSLLLAAEEKQIFDHSESVPEREIISMIKGFCEIKDENIRKRIIDLVRVLSENKEYA